MDYEKKQEIPFGAFDSELMHQEISIPEGFEATIEGNKIVLKKTESEDKKIRKEIINILRGETCYTSKEDTDKYVAWLEKQGEQKPVDKIKPKYKVGDWIVSKYGDVFQIKEVVAGGYKLLCPSGNEEINSIHEVDKSSRLLTMFDIQELKRRALNPNAVKDLERAILAAHPTFEQKEKLSHKEVSKKSEQDGRWKWDEDDEKFFKENILIGLGNINEVSEELYNRIIDWVSLIKKRLS